MPKGALVLDSEKPRKKAKRVTDPKQKLKLLKELSGINQEIEAGRKIREKMFEKDDKLLSRARVIEEKLGIGS